MQLPVKNALQGLRNTEFYAPGSIFAVDVDRTDPDASLFNAPVPAVWFEGGPAFDVTDPSQAKVVARFPEGKDKQLLSGWLLGGEKVAGKAAMVDVTKGKGHVVLFGFRPQYRGQSEATYTLIWGAILRGENTIRP
jgi:hypothetical protein